MQKKLLASLVGLAFAQPMYVAEAGAGEAKVIPIENLMDASLDDVADLPAFEIPPKGHYKLRLEKFEQVTTSSDKPATSMRIVVVSTLELTNKSEAPIKDGTKFGPLFMMDNEFGQGAFKQVAKAFAKGLGMVSPKVSEIMALTNIEFTAAVGQRQDKNDKERFYPTLANIEVVAG